jgi:hypothetical protein
MTTMKAALHLPIISDRTVTSKAKPRLRLA